MGVTTNWLCPETVCAKVEACLDQGITTFDQADIYGGYEAEAILGAALTPALRDRMEIVTKCDIVAPMGRYADAKVKYYDTSRAHIRKSVETSLTEMAIANFAETGTIPDNPPGARELFMICVMEAQFSAMEAEGPVGEFMKESAEIVEAIAETL